MKIGQLRLSLVGMSNAGKSYWSQRLAAEAGFTHLCCDDLIERELGNELLELGYSGGIADMAKWMGQPYDKQFPVNQQRYLDLETDTLRTIMAELQNSTLKGNIIIDTTGSVVHTSPAIRHKLSELTTVIYLEATKAMRHQMFELYIKEPKPVVWGDIFKAEKGESDNEALARCYPELLKYRSTLYAEMADVTVPRNTSLALADSAAFLAYVKGALPQT